MPESIRTFIAFEIPEQVLSAIGKIQEVLKSYKFNIKWVRPESIHLTLKFLGNIDPAAVKQIESVLRDTVKPYVPFSIQAKGLGVFPGVKRPRVIWIGITGQIDRLIGLHRNLNKDLMAIGFSRDKRPFKGHLTLGRVKGGIDANRMRSVLTKYNDPDTVQKRFASNRSCLYKTFTFSPLIFFQVLKIWICSNSAQFRWG
jgi:2'-5' RNA ligase